MLSVDELDAAIYWKLMVDAEHDKQQSLFFMTTINQNEWMARDRKRYARPARGNAAGADAAPPAAPSRKQPFLVQGPAPAPTTPTMVGKDEAHHAVADAQRSGTQVKRLVHEAQVAKAAQDHGQGIRRHHGVIRTIPPAPASSLMPRMRKR